MTFGQNLREIRKNQKVTQKELSSRTGIPQQYISRIERGLVSPSLTVVLKILNPLGYDVKVLRKDEVDEQQQ